MFKVGEAKTKGGEPARIYAVEQKGDCPIHGAIFRDGTWRAYDWYPDGSSWSGRKDLDDLEPNDKPLKFVSFGKLEQKDDRVTFSSLDFGFPDKLIGKRVQVTVEEIRVPEAEKNS